MAAPNPQALRWLPHSSSGSLASILPSLAAPRLRSRYLISILWDWRFCEVQAGKKGVSSHLPSQEGEKGA